MSKKLWKTVMELEWKPILIDNEYSGYDITNTGLIRSSKRAKIIAPTTLKTGAQQVTLFVNGKPLSKKVHDLVARAFLPNPESRLMVQHIDGNKSNNDVRNLIWSGPTKYGYIGTRPYREGKRGMDSPRSKYTDEQIVKICELLQEDKYNNCEIGKMVGVPTQLVSNIKAKNCWTHISDRYKFHRNEHRPRGENSKVSIYTNEQIHEVCRLLNKRVPFREIERLTKVKPNTTSQIRNGKIWTHIGVQYGFKRKED